MKDVIHAFDRFGNGGAVADVAFEEFTFKAAQIFTPARAEIIQNAYFGFALVVFDYMAADEPGASGDKNAFHFMNSFTIFLSFFSCSIRRLTSMNCVRQRSRL